MTSAIIRSMAGPEALGRSLAPLVRGAVEGLLGEVIIVARQGDEDSREVAEAAGATLFDASDWLQGFAGAVVQARYDRLLVLDSGVVLGETFWPELADRLRSGHKGVLATTPERTGVPAGVLRWLTGRPSLDQALVLPKSLARGDPWLTVQRPTPLRARSYRMASG